MGFHSINSDLHFCSFSLDSVAHLWGRFRILWIVRAAAVFGVYVYIYCAFIFLLAFSNSGDSYKLCLGGSRLVIFNDSRSIFDLYMFRKSMPSMPSKLEKISSPAIWNWCLNLMPFITKLPNAAPCVLTDWFGPFMPTKHCLVNSNVFLDNKVYLFECTMIGSLMGVIQCQPAVWHASSK